LTISTVETVTHSTAQPQQPGQ